MPFYISHVNIWLYVHRQTSERVRHECAVVSGGRFHHGQVSSVSLSVVTSQAEFAATLFVRLSASVPSLAEISGMLHTSRPDNSSDVLLQLHTAPNCHYRVRFLYLQQVKCHQKLNTELGFLSRSL